MTTSAVPEVTLNSALQQAVKAAGKLQHELSDTKASLKAAHNSRATVANQRYELTCLKAQCNQADVRAGAALAYANILRDQIREKETQAVCMAEAARRAAEECRGMAEESCRPRN
jgi:D-ribose pyranose/furanose isomerase RbsD